MVWSLSGAPGALMEFRVLGDVGVRAAGVPVDAGHARQRAVLAVLLLDLGRVVPASRLVDRVWGEEPPVSVRNVLYGYIARLRAVIAAGGDPGVALSRQPGGYRLDAGQEQVDLYRFGRLAAEAARCGDDGRAGELLAGALALWRGPALAGLDSAWLNGMRESLEAQRRTAALDLGEIMLRQGRHAALVTSLAAEAVTGPADERLIGQLMLALYRSGRQAEALRRFERTRQRLAEEFGADPGPRLRALHQQILRADPALAPPGPADDLSLNPPGLPGRRARRQPTPAGAAAGRNPEPEVAGGRPGRLRAPAAACRAAWRLGRERRLVALVGVALAAAAPACYAGLSAGGIPHPAGQVRAVRTSPDGIVPHGGADLGRAACGSDAVTLASAPVRLPGPVPGTTWQRPGIGTLIGHVQLRYSPGCHAAWARFQPAPVVGIPRLRMLVWQVRAGDGRHLASQAQVPGTVRTGMLIIGRDCVLAGVSITLRTGSEAMASTRCVTAPAAGPRSTR